MSHRVMRDVDRQVTEEGADIREIKHPGDNRHTHSLTPNRSSFSSSSSLRIHVHAVSAAALLQPPPFRNYDQARRLHHRVVRGRDGLPAALASVFARLY